MNMGNLVQFLLLVLLCVNQSTCYAQHEEEEEDQTSSYSSRRTVMDVKNGPDSIVWVVQLSDLHFSVHNPHRAIDFQNLVPPALSMINPSLVLITGDLTDGKSKDLLVMKQNEEEWVEYKNVMEDVVRRSGLDKNIFYDLRGNHDNFGVPVIGGSFDFYSKYSINGQLGRSGHVNSVTLTLQSGRKKHLFVGLDSTMSVGLRGPTNLFGHPTDQLLTEIDLELSQWDSQPLKPVSKIAFGHFPLSFSASSQSGKTLKDIFLKHSLSAYVCGHLHSRFGKNLKRHHLPSHGSLSQKLFQYNLHQIPSEVSKNCSFGAPPVEEFWEWEMGDWRKRRAMRILAIDRGHVSFADIDFNSGSQKTIILPTFPLDSRFMSTSSSHHEYECEHMLSSSYETVRALVFSVSPIVSVVAKVYDTKHGHLEVVVDASMTKLGDASSRGDLYAVPWNYKAFEDPSADRFWLQIEATDIMGRTTTTELRPFSINGLHAKVSWTWKEFFVMGIQWEALYYPILRLSLYFLLFLLLIPRAFLFFSRKQITSKNVLATKGFFISGIGLVLQELCRIPVAWFGFLGYLFYLILLPWFAGQVFTDGEDRGYMTYMGWVVKSSDNKSKHDYIGSPDVMVIVLPHLIFVVLPAIFSTGALAAERAVYIEKFLAISGKKKDDNSRLDNRSVRYDSRGNRRSKFDFSGYWIRLIVLVLCLVICWKHFKNCRSLMKAYEMNPLLHFPVYSFGIPILLAYVIHKTKRN